MVNSQSMINPLPPISRHVQNSEKSLVQSQSNQTHPMSMAQKESESQLYEGFGGMGGFGDEDMYGSKNNLVNESMSSKRPPKNGARSNIPKVPKMNERGGV